jgi:hypothetical protein
MPATVTATHNSRYCTFLGHLGQCDTQIGSFLFYVALPKLAVSCIEIIVNYDLCGRVLRLLMVLW